MGSEVASIPICGQLSFRKSMADKGKRTRDDEIRVIEETPEEVVRLDAPKRGPVEKKGKIAVEAMVTQSSDKEEKERHFDPEKEWIDELQEKESATVPMGWFVVLGVGLIGVVIWAAFQILSSGTKDDSVEITNPEGLLTNKPLEKISEIEAQRVAEEHFKNMEMVVSSFLSADSIEGKAKYVRHRERVLPLMKEFYQDHPLKVAEFKRTVEYRILALEYRPFLALKIKDKEGEFHPILVEDTSEGILVDWESFVCFQPVSPDSYIEERPLEPVSMRVYATPDHFHAYEFSDESEFACYQLKFRNSKEILYGFVKRGGVLDQKFRTVFSEVREKGLQPLILKLRFLEGSRAPRSVLIEEMESRLWAFAENPAAVASAEEGE